MKRTALLAVLALMCTTGLRAQDASTTQVGGYGELHYNEPEGSRKGELDFHRFVIYLNHTFNDWIAFYSETELEHTFVSAGEPRGEMSIEQAFLEFRPWKNYGFRAGIMLPPVGILNETHEPPTFNGVERPEFHRAIIPTTWREAGLGVFGSPLEGLRFQAYLISGFKASGFAASDGLRGGRQKAVRSSTADMSLTGRIDWLPMEGLSIGVSGFTGGSTGGVDSLGSGTVTIMAGDVRYSVGNLALRAEAALIGIGDADKINRAFRKNVADEMIGLYAEAAYNVLPHLAAGTEQQLSPFVRYELINTESKVTGFTATGVNDRTVLTVGLTWLPVYNVAVKLDYQTFTNTLTDTGVGQFNAGVGYAFF